MILIHPIYEDPLFQEAVSFHYTRNFAFWTLVSVTDPKDWIIFVRRTDGSVYTVGPNHVRVGALETMSQYSKLSPNEITVHRKLWCEYIQSGKFIHIASSE